MIEVSFYLLFFVTIFPLVPSFIYVPPIHYSQSMPSISTRQLCERLLNVT